MVINKTIYLHGVSSRQFLNNRRWLKHELKHVEQYKKYGIIGFLARYIWYSIKYGYYKNPMEVEAREAELEFNENENYC
jgi:hypothetical protein